MGYETEEGREKQAIKDNLRSLLDHAISGPNSAEKQEKIAKFIQENPDYIKYELFYLLTGQRPAPGAISEYDINDEIKGFIETL
jgi:hypothetical protein